jgi:(R)-2-hydroxyacyl-CoA dehydratese activating ATPase
MKRVSEEEPILFGGGVARNPCVHRLLEKSLDRKIMVPENPQVVGALGAAILAGETKNI